jgi:hypothetical protein
VENNPTNSIDPSGRNLIGRLLLQIGMRLLTQDPPWPGATLIRRENNLNDTIEYWRLPNGTIGRVVIDRQGRTQSILPGGLPPTVMPAPRRKL